MNNKGERSYLFASVSGILLPRIAARYGLGDGPIAGDRRLPDVAVSQILTAFLFCCHTARRSLFNFLPQVNSEMDKAAKKSIYPVCQMRRRIEISKCNSFILSPGKRFRKFIGRWGTAKNHFSRNRAGIKQYDREAEILDIASCGKRTIYKNFSRCRVVQRGIGTDTL